VLGQLTGEDETNGSLDLSGGDGGLLVVSSQLGGLSGNALEDVWNRKSEKQSPKIIILIKTNVWFVLKEKLHTVDEGVQDRHSTGGNTGVGVNLLEDWK